MTQTHLIWVTIFSNEANMSKMANLTFGRERALLSGNSQHTALKMHKAGKIRTNKNVGDI